MRSGLQKEGNGPIAPKATKLDQPANLAKIRSSNAVGLQSRMGRQRVAPAPIRVGVRIPK
jgi:hypothetical protein